MPKEKIAVIGAGITGLSAAMYLVRRGYDVSIFEKSDDVGGLASGKIINSNIYEYGPHFFHTNNPEILEEIKNIAGSELIKFERTILIKFLNEYFVYPLSIIEVLRKLPKKIVFRAILSLVKNNLQRKIRKPEKENSETVLLGFYGRILYELFFKDYIYHVWGIYPDKFSSEFAKERIPNISASIFLNKLISPLRTRFSRKNSTEKFVENVDGQLFTTAKGYRGIIEKMEEEIRKAGGKILLNSSMVNINIDNSHVSSVSIKKSDRIENHEFDGVISTVPINEAILSINPVPSSDIIASANFLEFRSIVFVGILVNKPKVLPVSFMYFREHSFNRIYDSSYFSHDTVLPDTTILVAEISSSGDDIWWNDDEYCRSKALEDVFRENITSKDDILEVNVYRYRYGYPVYKLGYEKHLKKLQDFFDGIHNLETAGRQGLFQYVNGHIAIKMGFDAAEKIISALSGKC